MKILQSSISDKEIHEMIELIEDVYTDVEIKNAKYKRKRRLLALLIIMGFALLAYWM